MSGLENMKKQILDEANHSAEEKLAEAKARADEMIQTAEAEADAEVLKISQKAEVSVQTHEERIKSSCEMQRKKALLQAKQEVIGEVLAQAYEKVLNLDDAAYFAMIRKLLASYAQPAAGVIYFSGRDLKRMPAGFEEEIQNTAENNGGSLVLSQEPKDMTGGFILVYGGIEENCTMKAIFDSRRDELSDHVHGLLFAFDNHMSTRPQQ